MALKVLKNKKKKGNFVRNPNFGCVKGSKLQDPEQTL